MNMWCIENNFPITMNCLFFCFLLLLSFIPVNVHGIKLKYDMNIQKSRFNNSYDNNQPKMLVKRRMTEICLNLTKFTLYKQNIISKMLKEKISTPSDSEDVNGMSNTLYCIKIDNTDNSKTISFQKPKYINCGVEYLYINGPLTASYYCYSDVSVSRYYI